MVLQICDAECTEKAPFYWLSCFNEWEAGDYYYPGDPGCRRQDLYSPIVIITLPVF
jgi:hypothetical protein